MNKNENNEELEKYFKDIKKSCPLTANEEKKLAQQIKYGDVKSFNKLITSNLKFVVNVAKKYRWSGVPFVELIFGGNIGLIKAANKFDEKKDCKFITYAVWWIKKSIQECIKEYNGKIKFSDDDINNYNDLTDYDEDNDCDKYNQNSNIINCEFEQDFNEKKSLNMAIEDLMGTLKEREVKILSLYFGLYGNKEMTLSEIGCEMNLTNERVRKIKDKALIKMRCAALNSDEYETLKEMI